MGTRYVCLEWKIARLWRVEHDHVLQRFLGVHVEEHGRRKRRVSVRDHGNVETIVSHDPSSVRKDTMPKGWSDFVRRQRRCVLIRRVSRLNYV